MERYNLPEFEKLMEMCSYALGFVVPSLGVDEWNNAIQTQDEKDDDEMDTDTNTNLPSTLNWKPVLDYTIGEILASPWYVVYDSIHSLFEIKDGWDVLEMAGNDLQTTTYMARLDVD
jgi:hypothetical protein